MCTCHGRRLKRRAVGARQTGAATAPPLRRPAARRGAGAAHPHAQMWEMQTMGACVPRRHPRPHPAPPPPARGALPYPRGIRSAAPRRRPTAAARRWRAGRGAARARRVVPPGARTPHAGRRRRPPRPRGGGRPVGRPLAAASAVPSPATGGRRQRPAARSAARPRGGRFCLPAAPPAREQALPVGCRGRRWRRPLNLPPPRD